MQEPDDCDRHVAAWRLENGRMIPLPGDLPEEQSTSCLSLASSVMGSGSERESRSSLSSELASFSAMWMNVFFTCIGPSGFWLLRIGRGSSAETWCRGALGLAPTAFSNASLRRPRSIPREGDSAPVGRGAAVKGTSARTSSGSKPSASVSSARALSPVLLLETATRPSKVLARASSSARDAARPTAALVEDPPMLTWTGPSP
mmetsp:Transcript_55317/g.162569  ORF Transcript_55317/g.162569 Transcript_55317/m.162569 type:complete len:203 (+) Transcript_55317:192-800(+)